MTNFAFFCVVLVIIAGFVAVANLLDLALERIERRYNRNED